MAEADKTPAVSRFGRIETSYKIWLFIATALLGAGIAWGLLLPVSTFGAVSEDLAALDEMAGLLSSLPQIAIFFVILLKNISVVVFSLVFSPFFLLIPVLALLINGAVLGLVSLLVTQENSVVFLLSGLVPHGIFEIPAFIMAEAIAFSVGTAVFLSLFSQNKKQQLIPNLRKNFKRLKVVLGLLVVAAAIETWITPLLLG